MSLHYNYDLNGIAPKYFKIDENRSGHEMDGKVFPDSDKSGVRITSMELTNDFLIMGTEVCRMLIFAFNNNVRVYF